MKARAITYLAGLFSAAIITSADVPGAAAQDFTDFLSTPLSPSQILDPLSMHPASPLSIYNQDMWDDERVGSETRSSDEGAVAPGWRARSRGYGYSLDMSDVQEKTQDNSEIKKICFRLSDSGAVQAGNRNRKVLYGQEAAEFKEDGWSCRIVP